MMNQVLLDRWLAETVSLGALDRYDGITGCVAWIESSSKRCGKDRSDGFLCPRHHAIAQKRHAKILARKAAQRDLREAENEARRPERERRLADIGRLQTERDELRDTAARLTRERDEWEANEQQVTAERDELRRRLDAVLELHHKHDCAKHGRSSCQILASGHCYRKRECMECGDQYPCPTVKAARGEQ